MPGMKIGLGGIAKGYAVDCAVAVIKNAGFNDFAVNAGGDLVCKGRKQDKLWWVGIRDPRNIEENLAFLPVSNLAVVTSGDYERYFIKAGKRYSHILDPDSGWPVAHCQSVTIMTRTAARADALSTGVFVLGPEKGLALIEELTDTECVIIDGQGKPHVSRGLQAKRK
jgi:thiamine biosynthesis lipoprotein